MKTFNKLFWFIAIVVFVASSCKDSKEDELIGDYKYYLTIESQKILNLKDVDDEQGTMVGDSRVDLMSRTIAKMQQAVIDNESIQGDAKIKEASLLTVCDSLYRTYADMNPENKGIIVCFVKLIRSRLDTDGTVKDPVTMKYYRFWMERDDFGGGDSGGSDSTSNYLDKPDSLKAIDLGLSVLWANCNLGAKQPRDYGARVAWGDPTGSLWSGQGIAWNDNGYTWNTGNYGGNNPPDDITFSPLDVVTQHWGDGWRIPSYSEAKELCEQCQWKLRIYGDIKWYEVIGPNGNSIVLPLAGLYGDDLSGASGRFHTGPHNVNERGYYWTSTTCKTPCTAEQRGYGVNDGVVTAWTVQFKYTSGDNLIPEEMLVDHIRAFHMSIRPVHDK